MTTERPQESPDTADQKNLTLWCQPCDFYFVVGRFPMQAKDLNKITRSAACPCCGAKAKGLLIAQGGRAMADRLRAERGRLS